ncbi:MAG: hypothetical protein QXI71_06915 [Candidatus Bathyarchaeia archaeon]
MVPDLLLKLAVFDTPEEIFRYLKKHKLIQPRSFLAHSFFGAPAVVFHPLHPIATMPIKDLLKVFPEFAHPELAEELAFIQRVGKLKKPGILLEEIPFVPKTLSKLNPVDRLLVLHELGHIQTALKHPELYKLMAKFNITSALHEYLTHRKALKWLKTPLPKSVSWELRYPSMQAIAHFKIMRKHILPFLDYLEIRKMLKDPKTAKFMRSRIKSPLYKEMVSHIESPWVRSLFERLAKSTYKKTPTKSSFAKRIGRLFRGFLRR